MQRKQEKRRETKLRTNKTKPNIIVILFVLSSFFCCQNKTNDNNGFELPVIEYDFKNDSIALGDTIRIKAWLNDTSFYYFFNPIDSSRSRIYPIVYVENNQILDISSDTLDKLFVVDSSLFHLAIDSIRYVDLKFGFPHPDKIGQFIFISRGFPLYEEVNTRYLIE